MDNKNEKFLPMESLIKMDHWEQYVSRVVNYTSRYNNLNSYYYAPINVLGNYVIYPSYGDFPETYFLRSYGNWWKKSEANKSEYRPQDSDPLGAEDYITLAFEATVIPRDICIYETYNPGAIVRIWAKTSGSEKSEWILLWKGAPETFSHKSRKFHPIIRKVNYLTNMIRLEFNQSHLKYHYSLDAVLLGGWKPSLLLHQDILEKGLIGDLTHEKVLESNSRLNICDISGDCEDLFLNLPYEVMIHVFQYLDLKSLSRCAQVNKQWNEAVTDQVLYQNLSLKTYWYLVNCNTLDYFMAKCKTLKKLDLSWCGNEVKGFEGHLILFLRKSCDTLTHLSLESCNYISLDLIVEISHCKELVDLRLKNTSQLIQLPLWTLNKLVSLDLTLTDIQDDDLIMILKANRNLKHIILDLCEDLFKLDRVVETVVEYNKNLTTWSSWKTPSLTAEGVKLFRECLNIRELDLGWCLINKDPSDCLNYLALGCRKLKRLILSEWRGLNDHMLMPIIMACKELIQFDLLGIKNVTEDFCEKTLFLLPKLRLLDISFCDNIRQEEVEIWRQQYPHITIQRSCQYVVTDYLN